MKKAEECKDMLEIRSAIDTIDNQIVELISSRAQYVKNAAKFKKDETAVRDSNRVKQVINSKVELAKKYNVSSDLIEKLYTTMIDFFIDQELKEWQNS